LLYDDDNYDKHFPLLFPKERKEIEQKKPFFPQPQPNQPTNALNEAGQPASKLGDQAKKPVRIFFQAFQPPPPPAESRHVFRPE